MLKYEIKINDNNTERKELVWGEKYLAPNLSCVTGVTSPTYHLEKFSSLAATNRINNTENRVNVECENVKRQGFIIVKGKEYDTYSSSVKDNSFTEGSQTFFYQYIKNNDKYFYWGALSEEGKSGYTIDNILTYDEEANEVVEGISIECAKEETPIKIDTVYWIEDGKVKIDGDVYIFDGNEGNGGILKYTENGESLDPSAITRCDSIEYDKFTKVSDYEEVTKFKLTKKNGYNNEDFDRISFANYYYYVIYKNHYCSVKQKYNGESYEFVCEVPKFVLSAKTEDMLDNLDTLEFPLYYCDEFGEEGASSHYDEWSSGSTHLINFENVSSHKVYCLNDLKNILSFIHIQTENEDAYLSVNYDIMNGNDGNGIIVYCDNVYLPLQIGETVLFSDNAEDYHELTVYNVNDEEYVVYDSKKYLIEKNISDKVIINDNEYDIEYINGKEQGENCLVLIGDEKVPMYINSVENGGTLLRYGKIVSGGSKVVDALYKIQPYDGVVIDDDKYIVREVIADGAIAYKYASLNKANKYTFKVVNKLGNSTYVCEPDVNNTEFIDDFIRTISHYACQDVVDNQQNYTMYIDNKIFGDRAITKDLPFIRKNNPTSTDDYYDLFDDLRIFVPSGYVNIPLSLIHNTGNNILQDDIVTRDFFENEKKKAINPIVDMEKDVYVPKYIYGYYDGGNIVKGNSYHGSSTIFKPIHKINLNFHFRTRKLKSWKINDGNFLANTDEIGDNWFITDYHPYCDILKEKRKDSGGTLMQSSDLMAFLDFNDDDIFFQKSRVSKSFARLSFYDSTDPQTQSLLATSCVFVNSHKLFKRFIDNSRTNENQYGSTSAPVCDTDDNRLKIYKTNKISVNTEYLGKVQEEIKYESYEEDSTNVKVDSEENRISSRLTIDNKYATDSSSEGFYIYMFREYAENLHPKPIYMKVEFNHAGIGKTIPFLLPMHWSGNTSDSQGAKYNKMYPTSAWTFSDMNDETEKDLAEYENSIYKFKEGYPLSYVYAQTYIPLYAVYDFEKKEYGYIFDSRYAAHDENGVLNLNLFELKIKDESQEIFVENDPRLEDIKKNQQIRAIINVNTSQFDKKAFNYEVE